MNNVTQLTFKSIKVLVRQSSVNCLFLVHILICGTLYALWYTSRRNFHHISYSSSYVKTTFDILCSDSIKGNKIHCEPLEQPSEPDSTFTRIVLELMKTDQDKNGISQNNALELSKEFSSVLMNGLPLLGLNDYVMSSDYTNTILGPEVVKRLTEIPVFLERFGGFLTIREKELRFVGDCWSTMFLNYLNQTCAVFHDLKVKKYESMKSALWAGYSNLWAIVSIKSDPKTESCNSTHVPHLFMSIRLFPAAVTDSRNLRWTSLRSAVSNQQSGQVLYFTSGYLALQVEFQSFIRNIKRFEQTRDSTGIYKDSYLVSHLLAPYNITSQLNKDKNDAYRVKEIYRSTSLNDSAFLLFNRSTRIMEFLDSASSLGAKLMSPLHVPVYHRAFHTQGYQESTFWHVYSQPLTTVLIILSTFPAAICAGSFKKECKVGHIEMLSTLPSIRIYHSVLAWQLASYAWLIAISMVTFTLFVLTSGTTFAIVSSVTLLIGSASLSPLALLVTRVIRDPESVVVAVPVGTFILLLPGLLYGDLAFEVQRSLVIETLLCLSPVSGTALILRHLCATESLGITAGWNSSLPTSGTTISWLLTTLVLDCVFYSWLTVHILEVDSSVARFKNSFEVNDPKLLVCHKINKSFDRHEVLRDVSCELIAGQVVGLLGSNGAGKSTLMRIIGGFDNDYLGVVTFSSGIYGRSLGWCPQGDALFEQLTVEEHVLLYLNILGLTPDMTHDILESVGLVNHKHKQINILSGGMRRRLCLAIACCNHPQVILLDEPTTGCDSESRDLVRMKILRLSREGCAILISTHHMDDIEIICDQVWFLNDRILSFSGPPHSLILRNGMSDQDFELEVNSIEVENCFLDIYPPVISDQWIVHERIFPQTSKKIWRIPEKARKEKIGSQSVITLLLSKLESLNCTGWKISTPSLEDSLISLYQEKNIHEYIYPPLPSNHRSTTKSMFSEISIFWYQLVAAIGLRFSSLRSKRGFWTFLLQYGLFPFVVTLLVSVCCSDVNYPPLELSSGRIGGLGPLQFSRGTAFISETVLDRVVQRLKSELKLNLEFGEIDNSNNVIKKFTYLPDPVNHFSERQRLCALVIGDIVPDSVESTIALVPSSFNMSASELQFKLLAIQSSICSISENTDSSTCNVKIDILNSNEGPVVSISTKKSLSSNITLLTNTAAPHAGPICLKELVDDSLFWTSSSLQNTSYLGSSFTLYNHPLPLTDSSSPQFAERGYLGGAVIILFIFICTTPSSQTVVRLRSTGVKLQMHLAGITPSVFWIAHLLCDSGILILSFLAVYFAIMVGGPPVHGFFFQFSFWIFIEVVICFALAVTSANFGLFVTSSNFLSTQLLSLISAVFNGMFLKLFLDRHKSYNLAKDILFFISPSFVFSTAIFDLFKEHSTALLSLSRISRLSSTFHYQYLCFHFICQTLGYIALAIIVDRWLNSINSFIARIYLKTLKLVDIVLKAFYSLRMCSSRSYEAVDRGEESSLLKTRSNNKTSHGIQSNYGAFDSQPPFFNQKIFQDKSRNRNNEDDSTLSEMDLFSKSQLKRDSRYIQSQNNIDIKIESNNLDDSNKNSINAILSIENLILLPSQTIPINTTILQGENVSLIGLNGGGKSTLFRTITLSDTPILVGNIKINGFDLLNQQWNTTSSRLIGYVSQFGGLLEDNDVTVEDTLHFFSQLSNISNIDHKINVREMTRKEWNEKWFIPDRYRFFPVRALSSGNKRKLSLTIAQEHKPCLLLLDECTSGVDPLAADEMIRYLRRCRIEDVNNRMNGSMLFSSHRLDECVTLCDRLLMLHEGMIIFDGPSESLLQQMEEFYRVDISIFSPGIITTKNQQEFCDELLGANQETERILWYSPSLLRLIIHNKRSPLSHIISKLEQLREYGTVRNYKIKKVDLEEALTILSSKVNQK